ncbi:MAG: N-glycosylase [Candidatus Pacearchaeota archaeon]|nr:MAG: N-glycosylase [Candidatus Pacearchaeota archaeon]
MTKINSVISLISQLKKTKIRPTINKRMKEFEKIKTKKAIFKELCFCILTANSSAEKCIKIQKEINDGFFYLNEKKLSKKLSDLGYRFPNTRAKYIIEARKKIKELIKAINLCKKGNNKKARELREWLVKNIKGLGMKESSHFLRNIGYKNLAIIDFHIVDFLVKNKIIKENKNLTKEKYLEIEEILKKIANKTNLSLGELDLYIWYLETEKVLK